MPLFNLFNRSRLTAAEKQVLTAVSAKLTPTAGRLFNEQLDQINLVQRHADGKEVNLYAMRRGKPSMEEGSLFPLRTVTLLATVHLNLGQEKKPLRAEVWLVSGHVFSVDFNKPPGKTSKNEIHVANVEVLCDPMVAASEDTISDAERRKKVLKTVHSKLPEDYFQLVGESKGVIINDWTVCCVQNIRKIVQSDGNYYLLAEKEEMGVIGVKEDEISGQLYYLDYEDGRGEKITVSLRKFLEEFDGGKVEGRF